MGKAVNVQRRFEGQSFRMPKQAINLLRCFDLASHILDSGITVQRRRNHHDRLRSYRCEYLIEVKWYAIFVPHVVTETGQQTMKMRILPDTLGATRSRVKPQRVEAANGNETLNTIVERRR